MRVTSLTSIQPIVYTYLLSANILYTHAIVNISVNGSMLPSVCYTVIYMVRVSTNTIWHTDGIKCTITNGLYRETMNYVSVVI